MLESLFKCLIEFVRGVLRDVCVSSSDPSRGPSEYDGGHLVHTVLVKQEKLLRQVNVVARALRVPYPSYAVRRNFVPARRKSQKSWIIGCPSYGVVSVSRGAGVACKRPPGPVYCVAAGASSPPAGGVLPTIRESLDCTTMGLRCCSIAVITLNPRKDRSYGLGASRTAGGNTKVPFRARFVYYSSVLYRIILCIQQRPPERIVTCTRTI